MNQGTRTTLVIGAAEIGRIKQAMVLGFSRAALTVPPALAPYAAANGDATMTVLALIGQRARFERRHVLCDSGETPAAALQLHQDERPILPEAARRALRRIGMSAERGHLPIVQAAAMRRIGAAGLRLHPFDFPDLRAALKANAALLGRAERAYLVLSGSADEIDGDADASSLTQATITSENWTGFGKAARAAFLRGERAKDAAAARALLEGVFKAEPAPVRGELLTALDIGLSLADEPFLKSIEKDRAESVRLVAADLLSRVPGTQAFDERLAKAAACFVKPTGVSRVLSAVGLATQVTFQSPKDFTRQQVTALFDGLSLSGVAEAADLRPGELLDALPTEQWSLFEGFLSMARRAADVHAPNDLRPLVAYQLNARAPAAYPAPHVLANIAAALAEPLDDALATQLLASQRWQAAVAKHLDTVKDDGTFVLTAAMLPVSALPAFVDSLSKLSGGVTRTARDFADFVQALSDTAATNPS